MATDCKDLCWFTFFWETRRKISKIHKIAIITLVSVYFVCLFLYSHCSFVQLSLPLRGHFLITSWYESESLTQILSGTGGNLSVHGRSVWYRLHSFFWDNIKISSAHMHMYHVGWLCPEMFQLRNMQNLYMKETVSAVVFFYRPSSSCNTTESLKTAMWQEVTWKVTL